MEGVAVGVPVVLGVHQIVDTRPWVVFEQRALHALHDMRQHGHTRMIFYSTSLNAEHMARLIRGAEPVRSLVVRDEAHVGGGVEI
jgi:hypothetical protein